MGIRAVVFDMDGVLIDSEPIYHRNQQALHERFGIAYTEKIMHDFTGLSAADSGRKMVELFPQCGITADQAGKMFEDMIYDSLAGEKDLSLIPGVEELIAKLHAEGVRLAVASSSPRKSVSYVIERFGLGRYLSAMVTGDEVHHGKPDPAIYLTAARRLNVAPQQAAAVEDSAHGLAAAVAAGMRTVAFNGTNGGLLADSAADLKIWAYTDDTYRQIMAL